MFVAAIKFIARKNYCNSIKRNLFALLFTCLLTQPATGNSGTCYVDTIVGKHACKNGDTVRWLGNNDLSGAFIQYYCDLTNQIINIEGKYKTIPKSGETTFSEVICIFEDKIVRQ